MIIEVTETFEKDFKRLSKKYPSLPKDIKTIRQELIDNPNLGVSLFGGFRKIRMAITSKGKGKRGGARIITFNYLVNTPQGKIVLVTMYDKNEQENISDKEIKEAFKTL